MVIRRLLVTGLAAGALMVSGCGSSDNASNNANETPTTGSSGGAGAASDLRIDVITHANQGDSFWTVVQNGAEQAGSDLGVDLHYQSNGDVGQQSTLIDNAVADGTDGLVISMANPDGLKDSIEKAIAAGVPVITINSGIDQWKAFGAITHVGQSETIAGQAAGEQLNGMGVTNVICVIQEAGNVGLEDRCKGAASTFKGTMENLQTDNTDLPKSQTTIEGKLQQDSSIDGILSLGGDMSGAAVAAVGSTGSTAKIGTFDVNADVVQNIIDGKIVFAIDQQPYVQGYLGVVGIYLKLTNGNDIGGGQPIYSGPAIITKDNAEAVLQYAKNGTR